MLNKNGIPVVGPRVKKIPKTCFNHKYLNTSIKKSFGSKEHAEKWINRKFGLAFQGMEPYECPIHKWHVGHPPK